MRPGTVPTFVGPKDELRALRAKFYGIPEVRDFARAVRIKKRCAPDLIFAGVAVVGGIGLVVHGVGEYSVLQIAIGTLALTAAISCVSALTHESWHSHLTSSSAVNDALSRWVLSPLLFADFDVQMRKHLFHHAHLGEADDPEAALYRMNTKDFVNMLLVRVFAIPHLLKLVGLTKDPAANAEGKSLLSVSGILRIAAVQSVWVTAVALGAWFSSASVVGIAAALAFGYFLPLTIGGALVAIRGHREHYVDEVTAKVITCDTNCMTLERWLVAGGQFNWHVCHHLFPEIPQRQLPAFARLLRKHSDILAIYDQRGSPISARRTYFSSAPEIR